MIVCVVIAIYGFIIRGNEREETFVALKHPPLP